MLPVLETEFGDTEAREAVEWTERVDWTETDDTDADELSMVDATESG